MHKGVFQIALLMLFIFLLVRLFPIIMRGVQAAGQSLTHFWWLILVIALGGVFVWALNRRNRR